MSGNNPAPDRWREYSNMNDVIEGTRFLPFKTPFKGRMAPTKKFDVRDLLREVGNLGFVVNLVKTTRYYNSSTYADEDVEYLHIPLQGGGRVPSDNEIECVFRHIDRFIKKNAKDNEKLIGVHCTHGVNRTGYVICRYMIRKLGFEAEEAIEKFETARGHKFDHDEYVEALLLLKPDRDPSVAKWHSVGGRIQPSDKKEEELELDFERLKELRARKTFSSVPSYVETRDGRIPPPGSNLQDGARTENQERGDFDRDRNRSRRHSSSSSSRSRRERRSRSPLRNRRSDRRPSYAETHEEDTHPSDRYWRYVGPRNPRERYNWPERYVGPRRGERGHGY